MLLKFSRCEMEFDRSHIYADVHGVGELYVKRSCDSRGTRWFECVREDHSLHLHLGSTHVILCRSHRPATGPDGLSAV